MTRYLEEGLGGGDEVVVEQLRHPDIVWHGGVLGDVHGAAALSEALRPVHEAFPDLAVTVEALFSAGDLVVARSTLSATHRASFLGVAATGRRAVWSAIAIYRVHEGRIVEQWLCEDWADLLRQVGGDAVFTAGYHGNSARLWNGE